MTRKPTAAVATVWLTGLCVAALPAAVPVTPAVAAPRAASTAGTTAFAEDCAVRLMRNTITSEAAPGSVGTAKWPDCAGD
jgi:hypothetical protein